MSARSVIIIGAGPAGLSAARVLGEAGLSDVLVLERAPEPGGLPRFAGHPGWGMGDFHRLLTGPAYARRLGAAARRVEIATGVSVIGLRAGGGVEIAGPGGIEGLAARAVLLATGIRETPRAALLVPGTRPWGVTSTGAFQEMVYRGGMRPFRRPVIVGGELVGFSALLTARHAGIRPVALIEEGARIPAPRPAAWLARLGLGVPVLTGTRLLEIRGAERVSSVLVENACGAREIGCDGVIFSGRFRPESGLAEGVVAIDPRTRGPAIDNFFRLSDPAFFAAGNVIRGVERGGVAAAEGRRAAAAILRALTGGLAAAAIGVSAAGGLRYVTPQRVVAEGEWLWISGRARSAARGWLRVTAEGTVIAERRVFAPPGRRLAIRVPMARLRGVRALSVALA